MKEDGAYCVMDRNFLRAMLSNVRAYPGYSAYLDDWEVLFDSPDDLDEFARRFFYTRDSANRDFMSGKPITLSTCAESSQPWFEREAMLVLSAAENVYSELVSAANSNDRMWSILILFEMCFTGSMKGLSGYTGLVFENMTEVGELLSLGVNTHHVPAVLRGEIDSAIAVSLSKPVA
jgi:hypothetical protein